MPPGCVVVFSVVVLPVVVWRGEGVCTSDDAVTCVVQIPSPREIVARRCTGVPRRRPNASVSASQSCGNSAAGSGEQPGEELCQHHCPVAHVAAEFPQLCEAETEAFGRLLGTPVQRLATISRGDGICTTHVTAPSLVHTLAPRHTTTENPTTQPGGISA